MHRNETLIKIDNTTQKQAEDIVCYCVFYYDGGRAASFVPTYNKTDSTLTFEASSESEGEELEQISSFIKFVNFEDLETYFEQHLMSDCSLSSYHAADIYHLFDLRNADGLVPIEAQAKQILSYEGERI